MNNSFDKSTYSYLDTIKYLAKNQSDVTFIYKGLFNTEIIISEIFNNSKEEVLIFTGNSYNDLAESEILNNSINRYLQSTSGIIKFIFENDLNSTKNIFAASLTKKEFISKETYRIETKIANDLFISSIRNFFNTKYYFIVADKRMFRVETNSDTYKAICSFNSPEFSNKLASLFITYFNQ